jgi:anti-sigma factor RsiW
MTCRQLAELLIDFVAGELAQDHHKQCENHLKRCPSCVTFVETYQLTIRLTRQLPRSSLPTDFETRLRSVLIAELSSGDRASREG